MTVSEATQSEEERIIALLEERGINGIAGLLAGLEGDGVSQEVILTTIKWWDDLPSSSKGTGLLVSKLRDGGVVGYKRVHERTGVEGELVVGPKELANIKRICLTPDGVDRETVREMISVLATKANTSADELVDAVLAPEWQETPPHPAKAYTPDTILGSVRYQAWLHRIYSEERPDDPDPMVQRKKGESDFDYGVRFWRWKDPEDLPERARKLKEARAAEIAKKRSAAPQALPESVSATVAELPEAASVPQESPSTEAVVDPALDERYGVEAPWTDEDLDPEDPW